MPLFSLDKNIIYYYIMNSFNAISNYINKSYQIPIISLPLGPLDKLSIDASNAMLYSGTGTVKQAGAFGVKLLYSKYTKPTIQIKIGSSGTPTDFYADSSGNLGTSLFATGTSLAAYLSGGGTAYVTKWYDQTGNGHHATAVIAVDGPFLNTTTYEVDFGSGYFTLADNSFPTGNSSYTYLYKQGRIDTTTTPPTSVPYSGGSSGQGLMEILIINVSNTYYDGWFSYDAQSSNVLGLTPYAVHAMTYGGGGNNSTATGRKLYINNTLIPLSYYSGNTFRNQTGSYCYLGHTNLAYGNYKSTMPYFYWMPYQLELDDRDTLGKT
jgi:hypothetical protein